MIRKKKNLVLLYTLLIFLLIIFITPFLYAFYNSLLPYKYVDRLVLPIYFSLDNYVVLFTKYEVPRWFLNTAIMTGIIVVGNVILPTLAGYATARFNFPGKKIVYMIAVASMMIPFQLVITPLYIFLVGINWNNTMASITVPFLAQCLYVFFMRQFFLTIPNELEEAARIDGLSRAGAFWRIIMPNSKTALTSVIILCFNGTWNSYFVPATFINDERLFPLVVGLNTVKSRFFRQPNLTMAGVILLTIPVLVVYLIFQKWFIQGITTSGIKG